MSPVLWPNFLIYSHSQQLLCTLTKLAPCHILQAYRTLYHSIYPILIVLSLISTATSLFFTLKCIFFLVCLSLTWMLGSNMARAPSMYADPSYEGYNCNKTWHPLPNYYRTDVLRPSTFRWFGGLLSLLITAHWAEILGLSRLKVTVLLVGGP